MLPCNNTQSMGAGVCRHPCGALVYVYVVVLTLTRNIKSVVTGQTPVTLGLRNTPEGKNTNKPKMAHAYIVYMMHFLPQMSDFVPLRNGFYSFRAQTA